MTRDEMYNSLRKGNKITHTTFEPHEWVRLVGYFKLEFEDGCICSLNDFWMYRTSDVWLDGYSVFEEK